MRKPHPTQAPPNKVLQDFKNEYDSNLPVSLSFGLASQARGWKTGSRRWKRAWKSCMSAEYNRLIGARVNELEQWQALCAKVGIDEELPTINICKKALKNVHVNLVDLLDVWNYDAIPQLFKSGKALADYTKQTGKWFGRDIAKQDNVLKILLRQLA